MNGCHGGKCSARHDRSHQRRRLERAGTFGCATEFIDRGHPARLHRGRGEDRTLAETKTIDEAEQSALTWRDSGSHVEAASPALDTRQARIKRAVDIIGALVGLIVLAPLILLLALLVRLDSRGPALFVQPRVGLGGRVFLMLKFRTMRHGADDEKASVASLNQTGDSRLFKIPSDPRVTRLGRVMRRWSLDEVPQLYNILLGDMALVGPRPFFESDLADYEAHHFRRLAVPPGLTGLWQVSGRSDIVDFEEVVRLDRQYIEHWSLALDLRILAKTLPAVASRRGAY